MGEYEGKYAKVSPILRNLHICIFVHIWSHYVPGKTVTGYHFQILVYLKFKKSLVCYE
ncbi:hypothetical protein GCM10027018_19830 [Paenibacillus thermoaerophilus]